MRNAQLREDCGFDPFLGIKAVPTASAYTRFLKRLRPREVWERVLEIFIFLVVSDRPEMQLRVESHCCYPKTGRST